MFSEFGKNPPIGETLVEEEEKEVGGDPFNIEGVSEELARFNLFVLIQNEEFDRVDALVKKFGFSDSFVQESAKHALENLIYHDSAMEIIARYDLSEDTVREVIKNELIDRIKDFIWSSKEKIQSLMNKFAMVDDLLEQPEVLEAIRSGLIGLIEDQTSQYVNGHIIAEFVEFLDKEKKVCLSENVRQVAIARAREVLLKCHAPGYEEVRLFNKVFEISENDLLETHVDNLVGLMDGSYFGSIGRYLEAFPLSNLVFSSEKVQDVVASTLPKKLSNPYQYHEADNLIEIFHPPLEVVKKAVSDKFRDLLFSGDSEVSSAKDLLDRYHQYLPAEDYESTVKISFLLAIERKADISFLERIIKTFSLSDSFVKSERVLVAASESFVSIVGMGYTIEYIDKFKTFFGISDGVLFSCLDKHPILSSLIKKAGIKNGTELTEFAKKYPSFVNWLVTNHEECVLDLADFGNDSDLSLMDLNVLKKTGFDLNKFSEKDNEKYYEDAYRQIKGSEKVDWGDEVNILGPFEKGVRKFGYKKMFRYINREGLSHHDALHNFDKILELFESSEVRPAQFYAQILDQVRRDDSQYDTGTAHHELNSLANVINLDIRDTLAKTRKYADIEKLQSLVAELGASEQVFSSWKSLKKYKEVCELLGRTEILDQLKELKISGKTELYRFVETLAFHPDISMGKVFQFWRDPATFMDLEDAHSGAGVHDRKKPSNYTHIPNLDLTAENLRDAQVEGKLDELQAFRPLEIYYELPRAGEAGAVVDGNVDLATLVKEAVGSFKEKKVGKARDPKKLLKELNGLLKNAGVDYQDLIAGKNIAPEVESRIKTLIEDDKIGYKRTAQVETVRYRAKINLKSDPDGVTAGNDTACCMPFGSGKNNVYTFNPTCSLFTVQQERADGTWRTVAQSVMTKDKDIKRNVSEVLKLINDPSKPKLDKILPEDILVAGKSIMACDNVELTPNVRGHMLTEGQIEMIYRDFMAEYLARYAKSDNLSDKQVVIGKGYSDSLTHLPQIENTFAPSAPVAYSDKTHDKVFQLIPKLAQGVKKQVIKHERPGTNEALGTSQKEVSYLTFEDSIAVAYLEGKIYADNQSLVQYLHNMENGLIAKDINNHAKGRANMSFKHTGEDGKIHGYLLAYEGRLEESEYEGEQVIFVSDIASDQKNPGTGKALMMALLEQYRRNYVNKGNFVPIYAQAREKTSYAIIMKKLKEYGAQAGLELELEEVGKYDVEGDTMHQILIRVKK
ncbi:MAG TPA: hypothetical protein PLV72_03220 [Candidatus Magasanikbacteria bacterium]|nr:hypothetical protein [Candidatus Magasanikbacteria bacterium]